MTSRAGIPHLAAVALLAAGPAGAADWSGFYVGGTLGHGWSRGETRYLALPTSAAFADLRETAVRPDTGGLVLGVQIGRNWQRGPVLYGVEGDIAWSDMEGVQRVSPIVRDDGTPFPGAGHLEAGQDTHWLGTVRGRIGMVPTGPWLAYFTAGVAVARVAYRAGTDFRPVGTESFPAAFTRTSTGWTAGVGMERTFAGQWSARVEYLYCDLGTETMTAGGVPPRGVQYEWDTRTQLLRAGVNVRF